jgi:hypothetical protein
MTDWRGWPTTIRDYDRTKAHYNEPLFDAYARAVRDIGKQLRQMREAAVGDILKA